MLPMSEIADAREVTETKEIQKLLYGMMKDFHEICEKHELYYVVYAGTMLGAVRHQAIIPWDDDIDVCMPRKDYDKFRDIVNSQYKEKYTVKSYCDKNYVYPFNKLCLNDTLLLETSLESSYSNIMLYLDIFPVDGYPTAEDEKKHFAKLRSLKKARCKAICRITPSQTWWKKPFALVRFIQYAPYKLIGYKYFLQKEVIEGKKYDFDTSEFVSLKGSGEFEKGKLDKRIFLRRELYAFGSMQVWGLSDYDAHLKRLYGDYMTLPPPEKRTSLHDYKLYVRKEQRK